MKSAIREPFYSQHPLPGGVFTVVASALVWCAGVLDCVALLQDPAGEIFLAVQVAGVYGSSPASLYTRDGRWRNCASRFPLSGEAALRFTTDFSSAAITLPRAWTDLLAAAPAPAPVPTAAVRGGGPRRVLTLGPDPGRGGE